ncbi:MAG: hypothetical protein HQL50_02895 [Magnetococcales bacterium]|nr:hypothetical protein [Magnetococcales bacterium]
MTTQVFSFKRNGNTDQSQVISRDALHPISLKRYQKRLDAISLSFDWKTGRGMKRRTKRILNSRNVIRRTEYIEKVIRSMRKNIRAYERAYANALPERRVPEVAAYLTIIKKKLSLSRALLSILKDLHKEIVNAPEYALHRQHQDVKALQEGINDLENMITDFNRDLDWTLRGQNPDCPLPLSAKKQILVQERKAEIRLLETQAEELRQELSQREELAGENFYRVSCLWKPDLGTASRRKQHDAIAEKLWRHAGPNALRGGNEALSNPGSWCVVRECVPLEQAEPLIKGLRKIGLHAAREPVDELIRQGVLRRIEKMVSGRRKPVDKSSMDQAVDDLEQAHESRHSYYAGTAIAAILIAIGWYVAVMYL